MLVTLKIFVRILSAVGIGAIVLRSTYTSIKDIAEQYRLYKYRGGTKRLIPAIFDLDLKTSTMVWVVCAIIASAIIMLLIVVTLLSWAWS